MPLNRRYALRSGIKDNIDPTIILPALLMCLIGALGLYAAADGNFLPWARPHLLRALAGLGLAVVCSAISPRVWYRPAYGLYVVSVLLLVAVPYLGEARKGAERWISIGSFQMQPSEPAKIALILCLARFFHDAERLRTASFVRYFVAALLILLPSYLVLRQPDLGTALLLIYVGAAILFVAGMAYRWFIGPLLLLAAAAPVVYANLYEYQRHRIEIFLNPDLDRLGRGYHLYQSKIAIGSGGFWGRGFMRGTQSRLDFLPEKHTDFAFTALAEQFGFLGCTVILLLFWLLLWRVLAAGRRSTHVFGRLAAAGVAALLFAHVFVNVGMVAGLLPVVGIPLPFISYGGTSMLTFWWAFGMVMGSTAGRTPPHER